VTPLSEPRRRPLLELARELGVAERLRILEDFAAPRPLMRLADLVVADAAEDALGLSVIESWMLGKPVVAAGGPDPSRAGRVAHADRRSPGPGAYD